MKWWAVRGLRRNSANQEAAATFFIPLQVLVVSVMCGYISAQYPKLFSHLYTFIFSRQSKHSGYSTSTDLCELKYFFLRLRFLDRTSKADLMDIRHSTVFFKQIKTFIGLKYDFLLLKTVSWTGVNIVHILFYICITKFIS